MIKIKFELNQETKYLLIASFFIGFAISFNQWGDKTFNLLTGLFNLFKAFIISLFILLISLYFQKKFAEKHGIKIEYNLWFLNDFRKKGFHTKKFPTFPLGIILLIFVTLFTTGRLFFLAVGGFAIKQINKSARLQKKFKDLTQKEISQIALRGQLAFLIITIISTLLIPLHLVFTEIAKISAWLAIFNILPFPNLNGAKMFFYERLQYVFWLILIVTASLLLLLTKTAITPIIIALVFALAITIYYAYIRFS
ncbi:hypothetical protein J4403_00640 [Candidatus Woesearchaeota archaeon]|nr:hypothetical protein [Candidatus Woesearchaeota archaeon]